MGITEGKSWLFCSTIRVSIQLISPTSGDLNCQNPLSLFIFPPCFHSINIPNEWGWSSVNTPIHWNNVSIQLISPTSGDFECPHQEFEEKKQQVSIQLISPTSGDTPYWKKVPSGGGEIVSIQLISPTSGDSTNTYLSIHTRNSFHSINIPNEWGSCVKYKFTIDLSQLGFHSINIPNEWGFSEGSCTKYWDQCFHSINIPNEWGLVYRDD